MSSSCLYQQVSLRTQFDPSSKMFQPYVVTFESMIGRLFLTFCMTDFHGEEPLTSCKIWLWSRNSCEVNGDHLWLVRIFSVVSHSWHRLALIEMSSRPALSFLHQDPTGGVSGVSTGWLELHVSSCTTWRNQAGLEESVWSYWRCGLQKYCSGSPDARPGILWLARSGCCASCHKEDACSQSRRPFLQYLV